MADFSQAVARVLQHEGGYINDSNDPGGETKYGISKRAYPDLDIANLTVEEARVIYRREYWDKIRGDEIPSQDVADNLLDTAVNVGLHRASKWIQRLVDATVDGVIGPKTVLAIRGTDSRILNLRLVLRRVAFYTELARVDGGRRRFLLGWLRRALSFQ